MLELNQSLIKSKMFIQVEIIRNVNTALQVSSNKVIFVAAEPNGTIFGIDKQVNEYLGTVARDTIVRVIYQIVNVNSVQMFANMIILKYLIIFFVINKVCYSKIELLILN